MSEPFKKDLCKIMHVVIISVMDVAFTIAMPSIMIALYFGDVSFSPGKPSGACAISDDSISWLFSLLEAILVDVSMIMCMTSFLLLTKSSRWWSIYALS